jgi:hypothetical protein
MNFPFKTAHEERGLALTIGRYQAWSATVAAFVSLGVAPGLPVDGLFSCTSWLAIDLPEAYRAYR